MAKKTKLNFEDFGIKSGRGWYVGQLRFYCFVNMYLSQIQHGIQTGHCAVEMVRKYLTTKNGHSSQRWFAENWMNNHKTFIVLNGGGSYDIAKTSAVFMEQTFFPHAAFYEDEASLSGIQTCVGVVVPEALFNAKFEQEYWEGSNNLGPTYLGKLVYPAMSTDDYKQFVYTEDHPLYNLIKTIRTARLS